MKHVEMMEPFSTGVPDGLPTTIGITLKIVYLILVLNVATLLLKHKKLCPDYT